MGAEHRENMPENIPARAHPAREGGPADIAQLRKNPGFMALYGALFAAVKDPRNLSLADVCRALHEQGVRAAPAAQCDVPCPGMGRDLCHSWYCVFEAGHAGPHEWHHLPQSAGTTNHQDGSE